MKKNYDSCVFKRDWKFYKTCMECTATKSCTNRPGFFSRIVEQILVWHYRINIKRGLKRMFRGTSHQTIKRLITKPEEKK